MECLEHSVEADLAWSKLRHRLVPHRPKHPGQLGSKSLVERIGHPRSANDRFVGMSNYGRHLVASDSEFQQQRPKYRVAVDLFSSANRPASVGRRADLRLRLQLGRCQSNANTLVAGHGHLHGLWKHRNFYLIKGRSSRQGVAFRSIPA